MDTALKLRVRRLIDVTHSTGSQMAVDFGVCELRSDHVMYSVGIVLRKPESEGFSHLPAIK
jgi:hypothetical protein